MVMIIPKPFFAFTPDINPKNLVKKPDSLKPAILYAAFDNAFVFI